MLKIGDKVAKIDRETNEVVDILTCIEFCRDGLMRMNGSKFIEWLDVVTLQNPRNYNNYELLTKDHEQRYQNFLYKQAVNEWFANKQFSFEEKEAIYNSFDTIENEREPNEAIIKAYNNRNKFFTDNNF